MDIEKSIPQLAQEPALRGWHILSPAYQQPSLIDGLSFEWDYLMIHDCYGRFTGIIGYVLTNPRDRLKGLFLPAGGNVAIAGEFNQTERVAEFSSFAWQHTIVSPEDREFHATDPPTGTFAMLKPILASADQPDTLQLRGRTSTFEWDLSVTQDWRDRNCLLTQENASFTPVSATDLGFFPGEHWTVDMVWPRTQVTGQIIYRPTGQGFEISGHGYRENSWGRWSLVFDGWDFAIASDAESGVQWAFQTYHRSKTLDYLDVSFLDRGQLQGERFHATHNELGWFHNHWTFDHQVRQWVPLDTTVVAANSRYRVEAHLAIDKRQAPLLSCVTPVTNLFFIMEHFSRIEGRITRQSTGELVTKFAGQAGGEFSYLRKILPQFLPPHCSGAQRHFRTVPFPQRFAKG